MSQNSSVRLFDFTGGLNTKSPSMVLKLNEASDLQNINLLPTGGFEKRNGNSVFNSSAMSSGAAVQGMGYFRTSLTTDYLMAIAGTKIFKADNLDGTMDDITGSVSITTGQDNVWTHCQLNNLSIFVGGAPDAPIKWSGTGNAAVLGGTPPSGNFCFTANNRIFIGNTSANPSRIYWSILGNPEDWSGTGSGNQDVALNDGDTLVGASVIGIDSALLFKQNSIHLLNIRTAPFPLFPLFKDVGAVSKRGIVNVDGVVYFITPEPRMKATDGSRIISFPDSIDDIWDGLNKSRLKYIHGVHNRRLRQIWWFVSSSSATTHDLCLVWDLERKAWLRHPTGFNMNASSFTVDRTIYAGAYDGKIYKMDDKNSTNDDSTGGLSISSLWRSGWISLTDIMRSNSINFSGLTFKNQLSGSFVFGYGFNFSPDRVLETINMSNPFFSLGTSILGLGVLGGASDGYKLVSSRGNGNFIQFFVRNNNDSEKLTFNGVEFSIVQDEISK